MQGRIENGTLFPNISTKISDDIGSSTLVTFSELIKIMEEIIDPIRDDIRMVLEQQHEAGERSRQQLAPEVVELKTMHEQVMASISEIA